MRNRVHLDVVRPAASVEQASPGEASGPPRRHTDPDGNEVDLVPGGALGEQNGTADWQAVFSAMACYRTASPTQQRDLVAAAAELADDAGDSAAVRPAPELVALDSGKDQAEDDAHGLELDFVDLAGSIQTAARELGATTERGQPRFVQLLLDAADVEAVRAFWVAALGYTHDRRARVTDIHDPRRLNPELVFRGSTPRRPNGAGNAIAPASSWLCPQDLRPDPPRHHPRSRWQDCLMELVVPRRWRMAGHCGDGMAIVSGG